MISEKQMKILAFPYTGYDALICDGAIRSGKTIWMVLAYVMWAMREFNGQKFGICGKTVKSAIENVVKPLQSLTYMVTNGYVMKFSRNENILTVKRGGVANEFEIFGGKDEKSYELIQGRTLAGLLLDEVALMPKSFFDMATSRCSVPGNKMWFNCNPAGPTHWFKKDWVDKADEMNALHLHFTLEDNPGLSENVKDRYRKMYTGVFYDRYILGLWVKAEGLIYPQYEQVKEDTYEGERFRECMSIDYGTQNPFAALLWVQDEDGKWHAVAEYCYSGREQGHQKTDADYVNDLVDFALANSQLASPEKGGSLEVIVDPSATSFIAALRRCRDFPFRVRHADNDVADGIRETASAMTLGRIGISRKCKRTFAELAGYVWDANKDEEKPVKEDDHLMDAMRYFVKTKKICGRIRKGKKEQTPLEKMAMEATLGGFYG